MDNGFSLHEGYGVPDDEPPRDEFSEKLVMQTKSYLDKVWEKYREEVKFRLYACPEYAPLLLHYCFPGRRAVNEEEIQRVEHHLNKCFRCRAGVLQATRLIDRIILHQDVVLERQITSSN